MKVWAIGGGGAASEVMDGGNFMNGSNGAVAVRTYNVSGGSVTFAIGAGGGGYNRGCNSDQTGGTTSVSYSDVVVTAGGGRSGQCGGGNLGCSNATTCGTAGSNVDGLNAAVTLSGGSISGRGIGGNSYLGGAGALVLYFA
jgi:loricrin